MAMSTGWLTAKRGKRPAAVTVAGSADVHTHSSCSESSPEFEPPRACRASSPTISGGGRCAANDMYNRDNRNGYPGPKHQSSSAAGRPASSNSTTSHHRRASKAPATVTVSAWPAGPPGSCVIGYYYYHPNGNNLVSGNASGRRAAPQGAALSGCSNVSILGYPRGRNAYSISTSSSNAHARCGAVATAVPPGAGAAVHEIQANQPNADKASQEELPGKPLEP